MKQADLGLNLSTKRTRKREFLEEMQRVVLWSELIALIEPHSPKGKTDRPPMGIATMLRFPGRATTGPSACRRTSERTLNRAGCTQ